MNNKKLNTKFSKILLSAILTIAIALSMIAGATYALFTSASSVNVAVTSATVNVTATMSDLTLYSPTLIEMDGTISDDRNLANNETKTFANGDTATMTGSTLTLRQMAPGDKVSFVMSYKNDSNILAKYRLSIEGKGLTTQNADGSDRNGTALLSALNITFGENDNEPVTYTQIRTFISEWRELDPATKDISKLYVEIELPADSGNEYQNRACQIAFHINAVQANANVSHVAESGEIITADEPYIEYITPVFTAQEMREKIAATPAGQNASLVLGDNITTQAITKKFDVINQEITLDLDNYTLNLTDSMACVIIKDNASLTIKNGTFNATKSSKNSPLFFVGGSKEGTDTTVDELVLDNVTINYTVNTAKVKNSISPLISSNAATTKRQTIVTVKDSVFNVSGPMHCAVYLPTRGKKTFVNTTITGSRVATSFCITSGDWDIIGGSYVGNKYELGGHTNGGVDNIFQDTMIDSSDNLWEGDPATNSIEFGGEVYPNGIIGLNGGSWGTGDAILIMNRYTADEKQVLGNINISDVRLTVGNIALADDKAAAAADGTVLSGPSGYGVRIYDVKEKIGAVSIKNITVVSGKQVIKGSATEITLPNIMVTTVGDTADARIHTGYSAGQNYEAPARP